MVITFVIDFFTPINGTSMTAIRFREALQKRGHKVRVVTVGVEGEDMYALQERYVPIASDVTRKQSMIFARPDMKILAEAFEGSDVIHFFLPYKLAWEGQVLADKMGIPHVAAFHCQPENVTYSMGLGWFEAFSRFIYKRFNKKVYQYFDHIHSPSKFIAGELKKHGYKAKLHVFSNGVSEKFVPAKGDSSKKNEFFQIIMIGRMVAEKRQDVLIRAVNHSKYRDKIQLVLAGKGPMKKHHEKLAKILPVPPVFGFYSDVELVKVIQNSDLYVHAADIEIEAIACLEAIACAKVPVIANSPKSATPQFALDERSLFKAGDYKALTAKIDYWIEHPDEKKKMEKEYLKSVEQYRMKNIVDSAEEMYKEAIFEYKKYHPALLGKNQTKRPYVPKIDFEPPKDPEAHLSEIERVVEIKFDEKYPYVNKNIGFLFISWIIRMTIFALVFPWMWFKFRLKVRGRDKLRRFRRKYKGGVVTVSNHVHEWDYLCCLKAMIPQRLYCPVLKDNIESKDRKLMRLVNLIPIPEKSLRGMAIFIRSINNLLKKGKYIHFYPETSLWPYYQPIRPFRTGAFGFAVRNNVPVVPMGISYRKGKNKKVWFTITIGDPVFPDPGLQEQPAIEKITEEARLGVMKCVGVELPVDEKVK